MSTVGERERFSQNHSIKLLTSPETKGGLGYTYLGNWEDRTNHNIEETLLRAYLAGKYAAFLSEVEV